MPPEFQHQAGVSAPLLPKRKLKYSDLLSGNEAPLRAVDSTAILLDRSRTSSVRKRVSFALPGGLFTRLATVSCQSGLSDNNDTQLKHRPRGVRDATQVIQSCDRYGVGDHPACFGASFSCE